MGKTKIYAVLMAGGRGTRLWPLSTESYSKSFARIGNKNPLIVQTIDRLKGLAEKRNIIIVVDKTQENLLKTVVKNIPKKNILAEPFGRSTASAIGLAAINLPPEATMAVLPTDALIGDPARFRKTVKDAAEFVNRKKGALLCIGVKPKGPSAAYGYIKVTRSPGHQVTGGIYFVEKFIEKPSKQTAEKLVRSKNYLWNGGMFVFKARDILSAMKRHAPLLYSQLQRIKKDRKNIKGAYLKMKNVSIDYQVMEKAKNLYCAKGDFKWRDLGSWTSMEGLFKKDKKGNIVFGKARLIDTVNTIVYNAGKEKMGVIGLRDLIVVSTDKGTLVCAKKQAEKVKELVNTD